VLAESIPLFNGEHEPRLYVWIRRPPLGP
jgi:hypothetical protein